MADPFVIVVIDLDNVRLYSWYTSFQLTLLSDEYIKI